MKSEIMIILLTAGTALTGCTSNQTKSSYDTTFADTVGKLSTDSFFTDTTGSADTAAIPDSTLQKQREL